MNHRRRQRTRLRHPVPSERDAPVRRGRARCRSPPPGGGQAGASLSSGEHDSGPSRWARSPVPGGTNTTEAKLATQGRTTHLKLVAHLKNRCRILLLRCLSALFLRPPATPSPEPHDGVHVQGRRRPPHVLPRLQQGGRHRRQHALGNWVEERAPMGERGGTSNHPSGDPSRRRHPPPRAAPTLDTYRRTVVHSGLSSRTTRRRTSSPRGEVGVRLRRRAREALLEERELAGRRRRRPTSRPSSTRRRAGSTTRRRNCRSRPTSAAA